MNNNGEPTADIKPHWFNLIRRLQSAARCQSGHAILTVRVVVDADGKPLAWTEPEMTLAGTQSNNSPVDQPDPGRETITIPTRHRYYTPDPERVGHYIEVELETIIAVPASPILWDYVD